ncbi:MAG: GNAT family N-acetyltransferase [Desulfurococcales archaeon]|nr:GNAT family N-acetyltransferase [Desulfurococcales archaeon]
MPIPTLIPPHFTAKLRSTGFRGLVVVNACDRRRTIEELVELVGEDCLLVAEKGLRSGLCREEVSLAAFEKVLGGEFKAAIVSTGGLLRPNVVAGVAETVKGGGFLAIVAPPLGEWDPGPPGARGFYRRYLLASFKSCRAHYWVEVCGEELRVVSKRLELPDKQSRAEASEGFKSKVGVPRSILSKALTLSQARALEVGGKFLKSPARTLFIKGDRGRGKSYVAGLILALAVYWHAIGRAVVVGPTPLSVSSLMRGLLEGLKDLGLEGRFRVVRGSEGYVVRVTGPWFRISYEEPGSAEPAPLVVIDEAAAVGVSRVRRLSWRGGKIVVSTTIHGYEGSGRTFARLLPQMLPKPLVEVEMEDPIRYPPGDPLEEWVYRTFLLKAEPPPQPNSLDDVEYKVVDPLEDDWKLLEAVYGILVQAHYRNMPDDLLGIMDSPHHHIHALLASGVPVAVADVVDESWEGDKAARIAVERLKLMAGEAAEGLRSYRVSRIAVHPQLQRRGLGSRLLRSIEEWARKRGADIVLTMFSRHDVIEFWVRNGYTPYYVSPRYNKVTGEKNIAMGKALNWKAKNALDAASTAMLHKLLLAGSSVYRDLAAEKMVLLVSASAPGAPNLGLTEAQRRIAKLYLEGEVEMEQAMDAILILVVKALSKLRPIPLDGKEAIAVVARVIQGKPLNEVASIIGATVDETQRLVDQATRKLVEAALTLEET